MAVLKKNAQAAPAAAAEWVKVKVTKRGHGLVSTGKHYAQGGEECFEEGEVFAMEKDLAAVLADENGDRRYVKILGPATGPNDK